VRGLQGNHSLYKRVVATPKHYTGYSVEEVDGYSRTYFDSKIPAEDLGDTYLPAWKAVVQEGDVGSIMCSCERSKPRSARHCLDAILYYRSVILLACLHGWYVCTGC
jgi:beta-glucosidase-like glycosyl hydrolase